MDALVRDSAFAAFERAVTLAGGKSATARLCDCTPGNIWQLLKKRSLLPGRYVLRVEAGTGVSRSELRPDLYPHDETSSAATIPAKATAGPGKRTSGLQLGDPVH